MNVSGKSGPDFRMPFLVVVAILNKGLELQPTKKNQR
jgi:hypothetical protein